MRYFLGIDNGGTATKAALYTPDGKEVAIAAVETEMSISCPGHAERDMKKMWEANKKVIRDVIEKAKIDSGDIAGISCCGHGKGLYLWGKKDEPLLGILSSDQRAAAYVKNWNEDKTAEKVYEKTLQSIMVCQPVALLAWLRDNDPQIVKDIKWVFSCKDYVRFCLTGEPMAELSDASGTNMLNLKTKAYDRELLGYFGIDFIYDALPPLCQATDICGRITEQTAKETGLKVGTPVFGGMFDINACALAVGAIKSDRICMIAGTWSMNEYVSDVPITDGSVLMNSLFCIPNKFLIEESSPTSAGNNEWFMKRVLSSLFEQAKAENKSPYKIADGLVEALDSNAYCPIFLPFVMGCNMDPNGMGAFVGLTQYHTCAHLIKSVYEGIVFSHRYHLENLIKSKKSPIESIRLAGGAARSKVWVQMFADILGFPIEAVNIKETGAFGCALSIAVASGEYKSYEDAIAHMVKIEPAVYPRKEQGKLYEERYRLYINTEKALESVWQSYSEITSD